MGWSLEDRVRRLVERAVDPIEAVLPEPVVIALSAMRRHRREFGVYPNLIRPKTFREKVLHRMAFDRRPILKTLQDKYAARDYVRQRVGEHVLPTLYCVTKNPADIPFETLPDRFVVKATHGCGFNHLVPDKARLNRSEVIDKCNAWLKQNFYHAQREWAYKHIEPRIMVEEFIDDGTGVAPIDYKLYVFSGRTQMIQVVARGQGVPRVGYYGRSWNRLNVTDGYEPIAEAPCPKHPDDLIDYAEKLGDGLDFVRVDLYDAHKVYFGEMTLSPGAGLKILHPDEWNRYLGDLWDTSFGRTRSLMPGGRRVSRRYVPRLDAPHEIRDLDRRAHHR